MSLYPRIWEGVIAQGIQSRRLSPETGLKHAVGIAVGDQH